MHGLSHFSSSSKYLLTYLIVSFLLFVINSIMQKAGKSDSEKKVQCDTELISQIMEYIQGISEVKSYNLLGKQAKRLNDANEACAKINTKMEFLFVPYHFLQSVVTKITGAVIVACSAYFYINETMSAVYDHCSIYALFKP